MDWSRNISSREIDICAPFWRNDGILRLLSSVNGAIDEVAVYEEPSKELSGE